MATTNIIELVKQHCILYKGGDTNPYNYSGLSGDKWAKEYLRFNVWDAEYSVVQKFTWWRKVWEEQNNIQTLTKEEKAEEIYKFAILDKLKKMQRSDIDFVKMYFEL